METKKYEVEITVQPLLSNRKEKATHTFWRQSESWVEALADAEAEIQEEFAIRLETVSWRVRTLGKDGNPVSEVRWR